MNVSIKTLGFVVCGALLALGCSDGDSGDGNGGSGGAGGMGGGGEPRGAANPPTLGTQIDRAGRPAISAALIHAFNGDADSRNAGKDAYNRAAPATWGNFRSDIVASLGVLDSLDTDSTASGPAGCGTQLLADDTSPQGRYDALAGVLVDDKLYLNSDAGTCGTYLGVEAQAVGAVTDGGCGGRTLTDDVIERSYSVLALGALGGFDDGVAADDTVHSNSTFPWVAAPQ